MRSLPTRECGLKRRSGRDHGCRHAVAPYTGAWIETVIARRIFSDDNVAPYTGAWIETTAASGALPLPVLSLPTRERGLKLAGLSDIKKKIESLPTRERGLKPVQTNDTISIFRSLPTRERGLKRKKKEILKSEILVAPYTGAWIETCRLQ